MTEHQIHIVAEAKKVVTGIFRTKVNPQFVFHNLDHTRQVVHAAEEIEGYYQLNDDDQFVLFISAWFHDTGFSSGQAEGHEKESIKLAEDFLFRRSEDPKLIKRVSSCIQATHIPQEPRDLVEKILCDADLYHLGANMFNRWNDYLRRELQTYTSDFTDEVWRHLNIEFLKAHTYFTGYCRQKLDPVKQGWIKQLQNKQGTMA
jgi:predicted metal-dependent HD superfamily phosphohydrolase